MSHTHEVLDTELNFIIDGITHQITNIDTSKTIIVQHSVNSERFRFEVPKSIRGHDMTLCNKIEVHYDNVDKETGDIVEDIYEVDDLSTSKDDSDTLTFTWLLGANATRYHGSLHFSVKFKCLDENSVITYEWGTEKYTKLRVKMGNDNTPTIYEEHLDLLEQWKKSLESNGSADLSNYYTKSEVDNKFATKEDLKNIDIPDVDLTDYYTKEEVENMFKSLVNGNEVEY